ncbi:hypothetical protein HDU77_000133 [Chytriomyces hyalinus]|nr:hypothetical protein HDU77_000133 [Chytriomyces hyalinus]
MFGQSSFGQPSFGQSTFGQSTFGQPQNQQGQQPNPQSGTQSVFGAAANLSTNKPQFGGSVFGGGGAPSFGSVANATQGSVFGGSTFAAPASASFSAFRDGSAAAPSSAFGSANTGQSVFGGGGGSGAGNASAFGAASNAGSVFGGGAAKPATSAFGGGGTAGGSVFGSAAPAPAVSVFGGSNNATTNTTTVFGGGAPVNATANTASVFGGGASGNTAPAFGAASAFGGSPAGAFGSAANSGGSVFGNASSGGSVFGNANSGASAFGSANAGAGNAFGNASSGNSVFGKANAGPSVFGSANAGGSVFGGAANSGGGAFAKAGNSVFGNSANSGTSVPAFGSSGTNVAPASATKSVFGGSVFGGAAATTNAIPLSKNPFEALSEPTPTTAPVQAVVSAPSAFSTEVGKNPIFSQAPQQPFVKPPVVPTPPNTNDICRVDFSKERPAFSWQLSTYGLCKGDPSMFTGVDISPLEARVLFTHDVRVNGNPNQYLSNFTQAQQMYESEMNALLQDPFKQHQKLKSGALVPSKIGELVLQMIQNLPVVPVTQHAPFVGNPPSVGAAAGVSVFGGPDGPPVSSSDQSSGLTGAVFPPKDTKIASANAGAAASSNSIFGGGSTPAGVATTTSTSTIPAFGGGGKSVFGGAKSSIFGGGGATVSAAPQNATANVAVPVEASSELPAALMEKAAKWNISYPWESDLDASDFAELEAAEFRGRDKGVMIPEVVPVRYRR